MNCDMCHRPLKPDAKRYRITTLLRPDLTLTVGPECYRKERKARKQALERHTPEQIEALRQKVALAHKSEGKN